MKNQKAYVIAEAGSNHDGKLDQAKKLIDIAAEAGADAVKFQLFRADVLYPKTHPAHKVVKENELPRDWLGVLNAHAKERHIDFLATPFDEEAIELLEKIQIKAYKWASSETTNHKLLAKVAKTKKPIYMSTGMCTMADIAEALEVLENNGNPDVTILHCYSVYPTEYHDANMRVMDTLQRAFQKPVGFSDHSLGISLPIVAAALGASVIEKHFTISRDMKGPDHSYAIEPNELKEMMIHIRNAEASLGTAEKKLHPLEVKWGRRDGIYLKGSVKKGQTITAADVFLQRPAEAIAGRYLPSIVGMKVKDTMSEGSALNWRDLE